MLIEKKKMVELKIILNTLAHKQNVELKFTKKNPHVLGCQHSEGWGRKVQNKVKASLEYTVNSRPGWATE